MYYFPVKKEARHAKIIELLNAEGQLNVSDLAEQLGVSEMSIRKDLNHLSNVGMLLRTYGGAVAQQRSNAEMSLLEKQNKNLAEKSMIGKLTASLITSGQSVMLDSGITTQQVAKNLLSHENLTVITNGLNILNTLAGRSNITLYTVGGEITSSSYTIMGSDAETNFQKYYASTCVVSVDGVDAERGLTSRNQLEANITRILLEHSERRILVTDFSKIGQIALIPLCPLTGVDTIVTDDKAPAEFIERAEGMGIQVHVARNGDRE
jgi:DeoR family transcriptional regulator, aga operon transcriptional repressor